MTDKSEHDVLTAQQAADEAEVSLRVIQDALRDGHLAGRNLAGRKGWVTTRGALSKWIVSGNMGKDEGASAV